MSLNYNKPQVASEVAFKIPGSNSWKTKTIEAVNRISYTIARNFRKLQTITRYNAGFIELPPDFNFTFAIPLNTEDNNLFTDMAITGYSFNLKILPERNMEGMRQEGLFGCKITEDTKEIVADDVTYEIFTGESLRFGFTLTNEDGNAQDLPIDLDPTDGRVSSDQDYYHFGGGYYTDEDVIEIFKKYFTYAGEA